MYLVFLKSNAAVNFDCVMSPIAEIVLVVIQFSSVIISSVILLPAVNVSCFVSNADVNSNCVISPIAEIVLVVISFSSVIIYQLLHYYLLLMYLVLYLMPMLIILV